LSIALESREGVAITTIMLEAALSHGQAKAYRLELIDKGFTDKNKNNNNNNGTSKSTNFYYHTTAASMEYLHAVTRVTKYLMNVV
jgi:predicted transcriptional regulator